MKSKSPCARRFEDGGCRLRPNDARSVVSAAAEEGKAKAERKTKIGRSKVGQRAFH